MLQTAPAAPAAVLVVFLPVAPNSGQDCYYPYDKPGRYQASILLNNTLKHFFND